MKRHFNNNGRSINTTDINTSNNNDNNTLTPSDQNHSHALGSTTDNHTCRSHRTLHNNNHCNTTNNSPHNNSPPLKRPSTLMR